MHYPTITVRPRSTADEVALRALRSQYEQVASVCTEYGVGNESPIVTIGLLYVRPPHVDVDEVLDHLRSDGFDVVDVSR
jgi:hypothetical protein